MAEPLCQRTVSTRLYRLKRSYYSNSSERPHRHKSVPSNRRPTGPSNLMGPYVYPNKPAHDRFSRFAQRKHVPDTQTHAWATSVAIGRIYTMHAKLSAH